MDSILPKKEATHFIKLLKNIVTPTIHGTGTIICMKTHKNQPFRQENIPFVPWESYG